MPGSQARSEPKDAGIREMESQLQKNQEIAGAAQPTPSPITEYTVRSGDSLEKISRLHGCRPADLLSTNGLKKDSVIHPGQIIKVPAPQSALQADSAPALPTTMASGATHTVAPGETFAAIARQHDIPLKQLLDANPEIKPTALRPGQKVSLGHTVPSSEGISLDAGSTQMILASKEGAPTAGSSPASLASPPTVKIQQIKIDQEMTYHEFASRQGTNTRRLNQLNGLDLLDSALLAKGSELLAPAQP